MIPETYVPAPVLRRPEYSANTTSTRLFNHSYPLKSTPRTSSKFAYPYPPNQQVYYQPSCQPTYPTAYQTPNQTSYGPAYQPNISPLNYYSIPQPQFQSPNVLLPSTTPNYYRVNPPTVFNSPLLVGSGTSVSSKGLETILIAILILVALDLVVIRPHRQP
ncbi:MAG: hypothetical protein ACYDEJ_00525 [Desulfitobacteriaceae bacterium]